MTSLRDILLRRRRQRQPMDETLPDGTPAMELGMPKKGPTWEAVGGEEEPVLTERNRNEITRPRVTPKPGSITWSTGERATEVPVPDSARAGNEERMTAASFNPKTGRPTEAYYREQKDPAGLYQAYENWVPRGGKRGFKNALKAGALAAASVAQNSDDPLAVLTGFGVGAAGGTVNPNLKNNLVRRFKLSQIGGELNESLKRQKDQAAIEATQMVPIVLENGQTVMVPAKSAATLQSRQQEIGLRGDTLEARKKRWGQLGEHEAARDAQALYNSGAADDSAELRAEIARRLRLPAGMVLPPRGLGNQIKIDDMGNYIVISPRSGEVTPTASKSYEVTKETGRSARQVRALDAAKERVQIQQAAATQRAGMRGTGGVRVDAATKREISRGVGSLEAVKNELSEIDSRIQQIDAATKGRQQTPEEVQRLATLGRQRQQKVNEAKAIAAQLESLDPNSETGVGEGGYPYRKPRAAQSEAQQGNGKYAGRRISRANVAEFGRRHNMTAEEAEAFLKQEGATIY